MMFWQEKYTGSHTAHVTCHTFLKEDNSERIDKCNLLRVTMCLCDCVTLNLFEYFLDFAPERRSDSALGYPAKTNLPFLSIKLIIGRIRA